MSETDASMPEGIVRRYNDTLVTVGDTYCVEMVASYVVTSSRAAGGLRVGVHMTEDEARDLCAGLKDALR